MNATDLLAMYERVADAPDAVGKLRRLILDLAVRGRLVGQDATEERASDLLARIRESHVAKVTGENHPSLDDAQSITDAVPHGWCVVPLAALGKWAVGSGFPKNEQGDEEGTIPFLKVSDMNLPENAKFVVVANNYISVETARRIRAKIHPVGTIIFPKIGGAIATNKRRILSEDSAIDNNCLGITFSRELYNEWAFLVLSSLDFSRYQVGTAVPALQQSALSQIPVLLPPYAEQHRIVAKVNELMALCDQLEAARKEREVARDRLATANLARLNAPDPNSFIADARFAMKVMPSLTARADQVKQLRQAMLNLAVRGKLVPQDAGDEPAVRLLEAISKERETLGIRKAPQRTGADSGERRSAPFECPIGWVWARVGDVVLHAEYGSSEKASAIADGVPILAMGNIQNGKVIIGKEKRISRNSADLPRLFLRQFDLLYNRTNSAELVGKTGIYLAEDDAFTFASYLIRLRPSLRFSEPRYLNIAMNASEFRRTQIEPHIRKQTGQANVNGAILKQMLIPIPPLREQKRIVAKVEALMRLCDLLETSLISGEAACSRLLDYMVSSVSLSSRA